MPRSAKGGGAERVCEGNDLFSHLPRFAPAPSDRCATFYLMTAGTGACELSRPIIANGTFSAYVERITCRTAMTSAPNCSRSTPMTRRSISIRWSSAKREIL